MSGPARISPTAHYTGHVWRRHGLAPPGLGDTLEGRVLFRTLQPTMTLLGALGRPTLEPYLLARHRAIDMLLEVALQAGAGQVLELAGGLSPRGLRFTSRHGAALRYVEADLPAMAARKRAALARLPGGASVEVLDADVLEPGSLEAVLGRFEPAAGLVVITEGLLSYLPRPAVEALWRRLAAALAGFAPGAYISDLHLETEETPLVRGFRALLGGFVRGPVAVHFATGREAEDALRSAGFSRAAVTRARDAAGTASGRAPGNVLEAWASTGNPTP